MRSVILVIVALNLFSLAPLSAPIEASPLGEIEEANRPSNPMPTETIDPEPASSHFQRNDCAVQKARCQSVCEREAEKGRCVAGRCELEFAQCLGSLPVGKAPALPTNCVSADQEAQRRIERQGEILDVDPTLFAESYNALIRARIACRAGLLSQALSVYDEIQESLREKVVPDNRPLEAAR